MKRFTFAALAILASVFGNSSVSFGHGLKLVENPGTDCPQFEALGTCIGKLDPEYFNGWTVYVSPEWQNHATLSTPLDDVIRTIETLNTHLRFLELSAMGAYFTHLKDKTSIYVFPNRQDSYSDECPSNSDCYFHGPNRSQVLIEMSSHTSYTDRFIDTELSTLIHELAHAYHDLVLENGFSNECVNQAYLIAEESRLYRNYVFRTSPNASEDRIFSDPSGAYAIKNPQEYYAEMVTFYFLGGGWLIDGWPRSSFPYDSLDDMFDMDSSGYRIADSTVGSRLDDSLDPSGFIDPSTGFWATNDRNYRTLAPSSGQRLNGGKCPFSHQSR